MPTLDSEAYNSTFRWPDAPSEDKYSVCVHCGFCLEVCPTYQQTGNENESPRGRVYLIKAAAEGRLPLDESLFDPVFNCLDCRACETACPSGVQVGTLIEETRGQAFHAEPANGLAGMVQKLFLRGIFPYPSRLRKLSKLTRFYQQSGTRTFLRRTQLIKVLPKHLQDMEAILPGIPAKRALDSLPERIPAVGRAAKATVAMFTGCVMDVVFSDVNRATVRVMSKNGCDVVVPKQQVCCGALQIHAGDRDQARKMARHNIDAFLASGADAIVINAAGCGAALKEYAELFHDDPVYFEKAQRFASMVRDISELLVEVGYEVPTQRVNRTVTYHDACHLCHAQHVRAQPRELLSSIPGLQLVEMPDSDRCCGSAGIYNLTHPDMANQLLERKLDDIPHQVDAIVMGNPGCMMQIMVGTHRRQLPVEVLHTVELLDEAYREEENAR